MKRFFILFVFILTITGFIYVLTSGYTSEIHKQIAPSKQDAPAPSNSKHAQDEDAYPIVSFDSKEYAYVLLYAQPEDVSLIANFNTLYTSNKLKQLYNCESIINGGYYTKENLPIGFFKTDTFSVTQVNTNALVNAFVYQNIDNRVFISYQPPQQEIRFGLQNGPMLIYENSPFSLQIIDDEMKRRAIAFVDSSGTRIGFVFLFTKQNIYNGPLLADLPAVLIKISEKENIIIQHALNLDGGTASAIITNNIHIPEMSPVGSIFCIR